MHKIGQTIKVKDGPVFNYPYSGKVLQGEIEQIELIYLKFDKIIYVNSNKDLEQNFNESVNTYRYGIRIDGSLKYFFEHDVFEG